MKSEGNAKKTTPLPQKFCNSFFATVEFLEGFFQETNKKLTCLIERTKEQIVILKESSKKINKKTNKRTSFFNPNFSQSYFANKKRLYSTSDPPQPKAIGEFLGAYFKIKLNFLQKKDNVCRPTMKRIQMGQTFLTEDFNLVEDTKERAESIYYFLN